jgi:acyl-CoA dehydrogenase
LTVPDSLGPELVELRDAVTAATGPLTELRARTDLDRRDLRRQVAAVSTSAGIRGRVASGVVPALARTVVRETLASHDVIDLPGLFAPSPGLLAGVGEPLRSRYLEPLLAGEKQSAFGFTEPADAARPTTAQRQARPDGEVLVINGQKSYVTGGADADFINTLVEVEGSGPAMVVVDTDRPGVNLVRRFESLDGSHHAAFDFSDVEVPVDHIVGPPGKGMSRAVDQVNGVRLNMAADSVGLAMFVVGLVEHHLVNAGDDERHRLRYGQMRIETYAARSVLYRTARLVERAEETGAGAKAVMNEIMVAKHVATETVGRVVDSAIQTVGGQALVEGHPLVSIHRRVRALRLAEGPSDVLALNIARGRLDLDCGLL